MAQHLFTLSHADALRALSSASSPEYRTRCGPASVVDDASMFEDQTRLANVSNPPPSLPLSPSTKEIAQVSVARPKVMLRSTVTKSYAREGHTPLGI